MSGNTPESIGKRDYSLVYVAELHGGYEYVGRSDDVANLKPFLKNEVPGHSPPEWVDEKGFDRVTMVIPESDAGTVARETTLWRMRVKGWENVRGYAWTKVDMERPPKALR